MRHAIAKVTGGGNDRRAPHRTRRRASAINNLVVDMRAFPMMRGLGCAGRLRRHAQPAAAGRRRRRHRRPRRVHRAAGVGRRGRRRGRRVHGSPRRAVAREERRSNALRLDKLAPLAANAVRSSTRSCGAARGRGRDGHDEPTQPSTPERPRQDEPRSRAQGARNRGRGHPRRWSTPRRTASSSAVRPARRVPRAASS